MSRSEELGTGLRRVNKYSKAYSDSQNIIFQEEDIFIQQVPLDEKMLCAIFLDIIFKFDMRKIIGT
jgi:hypothetical protein